MAAGANPRIDLFVQCFGRGAASKGQEGQGDCGTIQQDTMNVHGVFFSGLQTTQSMRL